MAKDDAGAAVKPPAPVKLRKTVLLSAEAFRRLGVAAVTEGLDESVIVESLINERLGVYVVQVRGAKFVPKLDRRTPAAEVSSPVESAA